MRSHPLLLGSTTVYGVMPDWNPAEIVGIRPRPLALSLYRELVTDSIWAYQRHNYGYRNLRSFPLMPNFFGLPYIDVRLSFNSFVPADLDTKLAARLVDYYVDKLIDEPTLHDKIEFEIVFSCYTFSIQQDFDKLRASGFKESELQHLSECLLDLTNKIIDGNAGIWKSDVKKLDRLTTRYSEIIESDLSKLEKIYWLLEDAKRYGTLPFAGLARAGFIAVQMLKSLVTVGIFSTDEYHAFVESISTVTGQLFKDRNTLDKAQFLSNYGHLRPGTYDILSPRYDETPEMYFDWSKPPAELQPKASFSISEYQKQSISDLLKKHNINADAHSFLKFLANAIEMRELSKFKFSKNLSDAMVYMAEVASEFGISKEDLSFCNVDVFREIHISAADAKEVILRSIKSGKSIYNEAERLSLPPLITKPDDVWGFRWPDTEPNFITQKTVVASIVGCEDISKLSGSIVCIQNADPGFDWLFSCEIAGLITAWGGANSHMAIRAGELGLPAVIGAGELLFKKWSSATKIKIDCGGRRVEVLE